MIKLLAGGMIFGGCLGLGVWYRAQFIGRLKLLRQLRQMLELLAGEVRYGRSTLPECCRNVQRYLQEPFAEVLENICGKVEDAGVSFCQVFREEMISRLKMLPLKEEDVENFLRFTYQNGFADGQMQLRSLEQSMELLGNTEEKLERENAEKCKMAVGLGAMSGLLLILILW